MATLREKALTFVAKARTMIDAKAGLRRFTVYLRRQTPSDGRGGRGATITNVDTLLVEKPRIRQATQQDVASSGGRIQIADFLMTRVTPRNDANTVGNVLSDIDREPASSNQKVFVVLVGPDMPAYSATGGPGGTPTGGGEFTIATTDATRNFQFQFVLRPATGMR